MCSVRATRRAGVLQLCDAAGVRRSRFTRELVCARFEARKKRRNDSAEATDCEVRWQLLRDATKVGRERHAKLPRAWLFRARKVNGIERAMILAVVLGTIERGRPAFRGAAARALPDAAIERFRFP